MPDTFHIDGFKVIKLIGQGGQGEVYHVRDQNSHDFALKWLLPQFSNQGVVDRFLREFHSVSKLSHPGIIQVFHQGQFLDRPYFTMELVTGENLEDVLKREKDHDVYYDILIQVSEALSFIHRHRMVHRDIKPSNILIDVKGQAKLMDFGLVKSMDASVQLTQANHFFGTMNYASPEQIMGEKVDFRSDLYSLGIVIYRMFSSRLPFMGDSFIALAAQHMNHVPPSLVDIAPNCPKRLSVLCDRLLKKSPWDRPASVDEVTGILESLSKKQFARHQLDASQIIETDYVFQPRFFNRTREIDLLLSSLLLTDQMSLYFVCGEQGIGRSRLLNKAVKTVMARGLPHRIMRCSSQSYRRTAHQQSLFRWIALDITEHLQDMGDLSDILPEIASLHPEFMQFNTSSAGDETCFMSSSLEHRVRYLSAVCARLTHFRPWIIVWDDIHLADAFEIDFLRDLMAFSHHESIRCTFWCSVRSDDFENPEEMELFLKSFNPGGTFEILRLNPFNTKHSVQFITEVLGVDENNSIVNQLVEFCHGHPSIIVQTIQHWIEKGDLVQSAEGFRFTQKRGYRSSLKPVEHEEFVRNHLSQLTDDAMKVLTWIGILEQDAYFEVLRYTAQKPLKELMDTINLLLLKEFIISESSEKGERYSLANTIVHNLVINTIAMDQNIKMHTDAAGVLEQLGGVYANPARLALHQEKARDYLSSCKNYYASATELFNNNQLIASRDMMYHCYQLFEQLDISHSPSLQLFHLQMLLLMKKIVRIIGTLEEKEVLISKLVPVLPTVHKTEDKLDIYSFIIFYEIFRCNYPAADSLIQTYHDICRSETGGLDAVYYDMKAMLNLFQQNFIQARLLWKKSLKLQIARKSDKLKRLHSIINIAKTLTWTDHSQAAIRLLLYTFKQMPTRSGLRDKAYLLSEIGNAFLISNDYDSSIKYTQKALLISTKLGLEYQRACNLHDIGIAQYYRSDYEQAFSNLSEARKLFSVLKNPRETLILTSSLIKIHFAVGQYQEAFNAWEYATRIISEEQIFKLQTHLLVDHFRTLTAISDAGTNRVFLKKILSHESFRHVKNRKNLLRLMLFYQNMAERKHRNADRLLSSIEQFSSDQFCFIPFKLQLFILRIHYRPDLDHTALLDEDVFSYMMQLPVMKQELSSLKMLVQSENLCDDIDTIMESIKGNHQIPAQIWLYEILAYYAGQKRLPVIRASAEKLADACSRQLADMLPGSAKAHFLSRPVLVRI
jgi:tetratricopeptide (TPR) repeat protein